MSTAFITVTSKRRCWMCFVPFLILSNWQGNCTPNSHNALTTTFLPDISTTCGIQSAAHNGKQITELLFHNHRIERMAEVK